jgi:hypothetical protein
MSPILMPMRNSIAAVGRNTRVALGHLALYLDGAAQRVDNTAKLDEQPVAGGFDEAALVLGGFWVEELAPQRSEAFESAALISADQPRIPRHIGREDRREPADGSHSSGNPALRRPSA